MEFETYVLRQRLSMFGRPRAFVVASPTAWNSLPTPGQEIRMPLKLFPVFVKDAAVGTERIRQFLMMLFH